MHKAWPHTHLPLQCGGSCFLTQRRPFQTPLQCVGFCFLMFLLLGQLSLFKFFQLPLFPCCLSLLACISLGCLLQFPLSPLLLLLRCASFRRLFMTFLFLLGLLACTASSPCSQHIRGSFPCEHICKGHVLMTQCLQLFDGAFGSALCCELFGKLLICASRH